MSPSRALSGERGLGLDHDAHFVCGLIQVAVFRITVKPHEIDAAFLHLHEPGSGIGSASLDIAQVVPAVPAEKKLPPVQKEVVPLYRHFAEPEPHDF